MRRTETTSVISGGDTANLIKQALAEAAGELGKLVYSTTSEIGVFFGATCRPNDPKTHLMGQTVLNLRTHEGNSHPPHAFFSDVTSDDPMEGLSIPIQDVDFVDRFSEEFKLQRNGAPGLSVVIRIPIDHSVLRE